MKNFFILLILIIFFLYFIQSQDLTFNLTKAERYVIFAGAAYCTDPVFNVDSVESWSCLACESVSNITATSFHGFFTDANGFVAYDYNNNEIIISFAGTNPLSMRNWWNNINFLKTKYPLCEEIYCEVHKGFYQSYLSVDLQVKSLIEMYLNFYPNATLSITGHSLGAVLVGFCAAELTSLGYKIDNLYTFGMPRIGDYNFQSWFYSKVSHFYRIVHRKDLVPQLPPVEWGYHHIPHEVFSIISC